MWFEFKCKIENFNSIKSEKYLHHCISYEILPHFKNKKTLKKTFVWPRYGHFKIDYKTAKTEVRSAKIVNGCTKTKLFFFFEFFFVGCTKRSVKSAIVFVESAIELGRSTKTDMKIMANYAMNLQWMHWNRLSKR